MQEGNDEELVRKWLLSSIDVVDIDKPVSNHTYEILQRKLALSEQVRLSVRSFVIGMNLLKQLGAPVRLVLSIPLKSVSSKLTMLVPKNVEEVQTQLDLEPPSLYLIHWDAYKAHVACEKYMSPLPFDLISPSMEDVFCSYSEIRTLEDMSYGEEFRRRVRAEYFPLGVLRQ